MSPIVLGVAALVAIDSFAVNVTNAVREQARTLMGGDVQITSKRPFPAQVERLLDSLTLNGVPNVRAATFPSMALIDRTGGTRLAQVRGVGAGYPWYGDITTEPAGQYALLQSGPYALVDQGLLVATGGHIGDTLRLGFGRFLITGTLKDVPGMSGIAAAIGPRIYVPQRYLAETQLLGFGATVEYMALLKLPSGVDPQTLADPLRRRLETQQLTVRTVTQSEATATNAIETLSTFIGVVGLVALLLGGVGVASGVRAFVARKIDTVAIMRCLGATSGEVLLIYVAQAALMGVVGAAIGALIGVAIQFALPMAVGDLLNVGVSVVPAPTVIIAGIVLGGWIALLFALRPLLALRMVSPLQTLRRDADSDVLRMRWNDLPRMLVNTMLVASVVILAIFRARTVWQGVWMSAATATVIIVLLASVALLMAVARRILRDGWPYVIRQGVANLYRPGNQTRAVVLALGFGAFLLTTLYLVQRNLLRDISIDATASGANVLFFDVQKEQVIPLDSLIRKRGYRIVQQPPVIPMRIAAINGHSVAELTADTIKHHHGRAGWALRREYRSTFRDSVMSGERVVQGRWFGNHAPAENYVIGRDTGEVSLDAGLADELQVKLNDVITWDVQGVQVAARVTSLREVTWTRFEPNFFAVFQPIVLRDAPRQYITLADVPGTINVATLQRDVVQHFPNISSVDLSLITRTIGTIMDKVTTAIRFMAIFSVILGIPVLFSAVAATRRERMREGVLLKTLGATRGQILSILVTEYTLLGLLGSFTGLLLAVCGGWGLIHFVFKISYAPTLGPAAAIAVAMVALTAMIGALAGRDIFRETAMTALRSEV
jgi:putative ABC transport system permease protein